MKSYAAMGALHAPLDALFDIAAEPPLRVEEIAGIDIDLPDAAYHHGWWEVKRPLDPIGAQMNVAYALAVAVLDGAAMIRQFAPERIVQDDVWALIPKIRARHDPEFNKKGPAGRGAVRLRVRFTDGTVIEKFLGLPHGVASPLSGDQVVAKFRTLTDAVVETSRARQIEGMVLDLENLKDVTELVDLLAPPSAPSSNAHTERTFNAKPLADSGSDHEGFPDSGSDHLICLK